MRNNFKSSKLIFELSPPKGTNPSTKQWKDFYFIIAGADRSVSIRIQSFAQTLLNYIEWVLF